MRIGLLSDVHGNADALEAVLAAAAADGVERLLVAGDLVGYYYAPERVLELLSGWEWSGVRGNHEELLARWMGADGAGRDALRAKYGSGFDEACRRLAPEQVDRLVGLPHPEVHEVAGRSVLLCHGAPWGVDAYVYPDAREETWDALFATGHALVVFGHTHYPVLRRRSGAVLVNPGSVGQPRDRDPAAAWAVWDSASGEAELRRTPYDASRLVAECRERDPGVPYLAEVLLRRS